MCLRHWILIAYRIFILWYWSCFRSDFVTNQPTMSSSVLRQMLPKCVLMDSQMVFGRCKMVFGIFQFFVEMLGAVRAWPPWPPFTTRFLCPLLRIAAKHGGMHSTSKSGQKVRSAIAACAINVQTNSTLSTCPPLTFSISSRRTDPANNFRYNCRWCEDRGDRTCCPCLKHIAHTQFAFVTKHFLEETISQRVGESHFYARAHTLSLAQGPWAPNDAVKTLLA